MNKTYRFYNLLKSYCPTIFSLLESKQDLSKIDKQFDQELERRLKLYKEKGQPIEVQANIVDLLLLCYQGDASSVSFAKFMNDLISKLLKKLPKEHYIGIKEAIEGKITNLKDWNYLNPIGELAALDTLLENTNYKLIEIEKEIPNGKTEDFFFLNPESKGKFLVEIYNIHPNDNLITDANGLKKYLCTKISNKIKSETKNLKAGDIPYTLYFLPIIWTFNFENISKFYSVFEELENKVYIENNLPYPILGCCAFMQKRDKQKNCSYEFAAITSLIERYFR